jgi:hypothetical protein
MKVSQLSNFRIIVRIVPDGEWHIDRLAGLVAVWASDRLAVADYSLLPFHDRLLGGGCPEQG